MVLRTYKGHFTDVSLKNNTPVNTEVLWGGGLWWGLWADRTKFTEDHV